MPLTSQPSGAMVTGCVVASCRPIRCSCSGDTLTLGNHALAVEIARVPEHIRGYGHVKEAQLRAAKAKEAELLAQWRNPLQLEHVA